MKARAPTSSEPHSAEGATTTPAIEWAIANGTVDQVFARVEAKLRQRRRRRLAAAGALGVLLAVGTALWQPARVATERPVAVVQTLAATVPRKEILDDGTIVELRDGARLVVAFTAEIRRVRLVSGEAHFKVAKNPQRPFVVEAGGIDVRAVGTAFGVQLSAQAVEILVTEGRVVVEKPAEATSTEAAPRAHSFGRVDAGNKIIVEFTRPLALVPVVPVTPSEIDERLAWRAPRLELNATPLAQALTFFNQHSGVRLTLADPEIGKLELSGSIRADNAEPLLHLLRHEFDLEADRYPGEIILRHKR
jgi:transmembrane sensor